MNINQAKEEIKKTVKIYIEKDSFGEYVLPVMRQRPIFMIGAPGIGKTAVVEQVAEELGIGLVAYSMTHHTRQSAIGLPFIVEREYEGERVRVSEYTMSEILASVYRMAEQAGKREGILFLDEINCVSETLAPAILQFLQYKTFGNHVLPAGWVIVSAGNPPQYNRSVREFDIATRDRLKYLHVEEDFTVWKRYAHDRGVHGAILAFLETQQRWFYSIQTASDGPRVATARGWEDLSYVIRMYEKNEYKVDDVLISQYITDPEIARKFTVFYNLYKKYREDYQVDAIVEGTFTTETVEKAARGRFDERISLIEMVSETLLAHIVEVQNTQGMLQKVAGILREIKKTTQKEGKLQTGASLTELLLGRIAACEKAMAAERALRMGDTDEDRISRAAIFLEREYVELAGKANIEGANIGEANIEGVNIEKANTRKADIAKEQFALIKKDFDKRAKRLAASTDQTRERLESVFRFVNSAWGTGQEMTYFMTLLTANRYSSSFIGMHGCESYYKYNDTLLLYDVHDAIRNEIRTEFEI